MILIPLLLTPMCQSVWSHLKEVARIQHVSLLLHSWLLEPIKGNVSCKIYCENIKLVNGLEVVYLALGLTSWEVNVSMFHRFPNTCFVFPIVCRVVESSSSSSSRKQHFYGCAQSNVVVLSEKSRAKIEWRDLPDSAGLQGCRHSESSVHTFCEDCRHQTIL